MTRGATALEVTRTRFNDSSPAPTEPLPRGRTLLWGCKAAFEAAGDLANLGKVFSALADLENNLGHGDQAVRHEQTALRYKYREGDPEVCAISHFNLATYQRRWGGSPGAALAHRLAAAVIRLQTGDGRFPS